VGIEFILAAAFIASGADAVIETGLAKAGEENGWRGYGMPVALQRWGPVGASLAIGLAWASWHYPVKFNLFLDYGFVGASAVLGAFTIRSSRSRSL
jgi:membrane protease YdiL (CAAX protease family)